MEGVTDNSIEQKILTCITGSYLDRDAITDKVTTDFVRLVNYLENNFLNEELRKENPDIAFDDFSEIKDEEAEEVLQNLPDEAFFDPISRETIRLIIDTYNKLAYTWFIQDTADNKCVSSSEFNNRANARSELGRFDEALGDYDRACELDPSDPCHFINRAQLLIQLDRMDEAAGDAEHAQKIIRKKTVQDGGDYLALASIYSQCSLPYRAAVCLERYTDWVLHLCPYITKNPEGMLMIDKDEGPIRFCSAIDLSQIDSLLVAIEEKGLAESHGHFQKLVGHVKRAISELKAIEKALPKRLKVI